VLSKGGKTVSAKPVNNTIRASVFLSPILHNKLKAIADKNKTTISGMLRQIVLEYLMKQE